MPQCEPESSCSLQILQIFYKNNRHIFPAGEKEELVSQGKWKCTKKVNIFAAPNQGLCLCPPESDANMTRPGHNAEETFTPPAFKWVERTKSCQATLYPIPLTEHASQTHLKGIVLSGSLSSRGSFLQAPKIWGAVQRLSALNVATLKRASIPKACLLEGSGSFSNLCAPKWSLVPVHDSQQEGCH